MKVKCNNEECVSCNMELECILKEIEISDNGICLNADNVGDSEMKDEDEDEDRERFFSDNDDELKKAEGQANMGHDNYGHLID